MIRLANFGGFLILIYIWFNYANWTLIPNTTNTLSKITVHTIQSLPGAFISFTLLSLSIIFDNFNVISYDDKNVIELFYA